MTELLYETYNYLRKFSAFVTAVTPEGVVLDRTAFYPTGGGQPCDFGQLVTFDGRCYNITQVKKVGADVWHMGEGDTLDVGGMVTGELDWERRYQIMRTHTAMHILSGVIWRDYQAQVTGCNMEPLQGRMDFEFEKMSQELVAEIEAAVNREVKAAHTVSIHFLSPEEALEIPDLIRTKTNLLPPTIEELRIIQLSALDLQADGGTHVANTSEVGRMRITNYKSKGKINKRIYVELD